MWELEKITDDEFGLTATISYDEDSGSENPRDWDNCWTIATVNDRSSGEIDELIDPDSWLNFPGDYLEALREDGAVMIVPVFKYEHGLVRYSADDPGDPWDSGQLGVAYIDQATLDKEWHGDRDAAKKYLDAELDTYTDWANGHIYYFTVEDANDEHIDSCGGIYGYDYAVSEAKDALKSAREDAIKERESVAYWNARGVETIA